MNFFSCTRGVFCDWCPESCCCVKTDVNQQQNNNNITKVNIHRHDFIQYRSNVQVQSHVITTQPATDKYDGSEFEFAQKMQYVTIFRGANEHRRLDTKITIDRN